MELSSIVPYRAAGIYTRRAGFCGGASGGDLGGVSAGGCAFDGGGLGSAG